jgi:hypothetical protein
MLTTATKTRPSYSYETILAASERVTWRVEDLIGGAQRLDFSRPFLPDSLAGVEGMAFLSARERLVLNQIRGHGYLYMFGLVEEFILPFVLDHARPELHGESARTRAYLEFASEEAKHIDLFRRFREAFLVGFGHHLTVIGPAEDVARAVLVKHPLAVALLVLHIEWMTQKHWIEGARDDGALDPMFKNLLKHHWMEEAQHAKLDELMVETLAARCEPEEIDRAIDDYLAIGGMFDAALAQQVDFDLVAFEVATGRRLEGDERERVRATQIQANRWTFIGSGMTHPRFVAALERVSPAARDRIAAVAPAFAFGAG